ncbi:MAG: tripartite tricarboxylate transporter substrate binding protein [Burkholderiaceae bacterium]
MTRNTRRTWIFHALAALAAASTALPASAQDYPSQTIKIVVPFAPGGGGDVLGRLVATKLSEQLKQTVIVENKPGASTIIATDLVAKSRPDGYTILLNVPLIVQTASLFKKLPYDPLTDLIPVAELNKSQIWFAVGTAKVKAKTFKEYIAQAKADPKNFSYGSIGPGSTGHLLGFAVNEANGLDTIHVPYKGSTPALQALLSGEIASVFQDYVTLKPQVEAGKVRLLAVTGTHRSVFTPDVPTLTELGYPGFEAGTWGGLFVAKGTPPAILKTLETAVHKITTDPDYVKRMATLGYEPGDLTQPQFAALVRSEYTRWATLIKKAGVTVE